MELESVQRRFTRLVDGIGLLPYKDRLEKLRITTLIKRRARGDIIELELEFTIMPLWASQYKTVIKM